MKKKKIKKKEKGKKREEEDLTESKIRHMDLIYNNAEYNPHGVVFRILVGVMPDDHLF